MYDMWVCETHYRELGRLLSSLPVELTFFGLSDIKPCKCGQSGAHKTQVPADWLEGVIEVGELCGLRAEG